MTEYIRKWVWSEWHVQYGYCRYRHGDCAIERRRACSTSRRGMPHPGAAAEPRRNEEQWRWLDRCGRSETTRLAHDAIRSRSRECHWECRRPHQRLTMLLASDTLWRWARSLDPPGQERPSIGRQCPPLRRIAGAADSLARPGTLRANHASIRRRDRRAHDRRNARRGQTLQCCLQASSLCRRAAAGLVPAPALSAVSRSRSAAWPSPSRRCRRASRTRCCSRSPGRARRLRGSCVNPDLNNRTPGSRSCRAAARRRRSCVH